MSTALKSYAATTKAARTATAQRVRTPGRTDEVRNNAGGFVFAVSDKERLERFLILGTDGGTYYVGQKALTEQNADFVKSMIAKNERGVIDTLVDVARNNRAAKNGPSIFVAALLLVEGTDKAYFREAGVVDAVIRTSTHLFEFANYIDNLGGWGRAKRDAISGWYTSKDANSLAYQAVKYRQREGWTHRDLFRKVHPVGVDRNVGNFILGKDSEGSAIIEGFREMQNAKTAKEVVATLNTYTNLPWETIPTQFLKDEKVWKTLFYNGAIGQTALLRNVTRFAKIGAFNDLMFVGDVAKRLADKDAIVKGRLHPVAYANALGIYGKGHTPTRDDYYGGGYGRASTDSWSVNAKIAGGLEAGFYESFHAVEPANKRTMLATDVSGSMTWGAPAGLVGMNYMEAAAVMAMVTLRTEPYAMITAFSTNFQELPISDRDTFTTVKRKLSGMSFGGTDVSVPMVYAKRKGLEIDTFTVYSDMETWAGDQKVFQALEAYRKSSGIDAKLVAVGLAGTSYTVADPKDKGSLNLVGFDAAAPKVLADFSAGRI